MATNYSRYTTEQLQTLLNTLIARQLEIADSGAVKSVAGEGRKMEFAVMPSTADLESQISRISFELNSREGNAGCGSALEVQIV